MAMWFNLLDCAKMNADSMVRPVLDDTELALPELANIPTEDIAGLEFTSLVYKTALVMARAGSGALVSRHHVTRA